MKKDTIKKLILGSMSLLMIGVMASCDNAPTMTEPFEAEGEIQGSVIDKSTGEAISGVGVTLNYRIEDSEGNLDEDFTDTKTTDEQGRFLFSEVPVNSDAKVGDNADTQPYMVRLDLGENENYRSTYLAAIDVVFESTGGDGASINMTSNVTIPLSKRSVDVAGKVLVGNRGNVPLDGGTVELFQNFNPVINGNVNTNSTMLLATTDSDENGGFSFSNVEEDADVYINVKDNSDPTNVIDFQSGTMTTPSSSDGTASMDFGTFTVSGNDESSRYNVTVEGIAVQQDTEIELEGVHIALRQNGEIIDTTSSGSDGSFTFENVEENQTMQLVFEKLDDESEVYDQTFNFNTPQVRGEQNVEENLGKIELLPIDRTGDFYIVSISPEEGADLESDELAFVYVFNRSVAENSYTRDDLGFGSGTFKDDIFFTDDGPKKLYAGDVNFAAVWSAGRDTLTITPDADDLVDANRFTLDVQGALTNGNFTDENDKTLAFGGELPFDNPNDAYVRSFSINDNNAAPHVPDAALVEEPTDIDWNQNQVNIEWNVDETEADVRQYEIWISRDGEPFEFDFNVNPDDFAFGEVNAIVNIGGDLLVNRRAGVPDEAINFRIRVRAVSANLVEGDYGDVITVTDGIDPQVTGATRNSNTELEVTFNEPLDKATAEDVANYTFQDAAEADLDMTIESVEYFIDPDVGGNPGNPRVIITLDAAETVDDFTAAANEVVIVSGVTDLAENEVDADNNDATYN